MARDGRLGMCATWREKKFLRCVNSKHEVEKIPWLQRVTLRRPRLRWLSYAAPNFPPPLDSRVVLPYNHGNVRNSIAQHNKAAMALPLRAL
jgi:hypothetical protein